MSKEHAVEVVRLGPVKKHPNADALSVTQVHGGYPVICRLGEYQEGDLAVYVPIDSVVPTDDPRWSFLEGKGRIRAKKLRGVFSMGLLTKPDPEWTEGADVAEALRIVQYEPPAPGVQGPPHEKNYADDCDGPARIPCYTDIESLRRYGGLLKLGEEVVVTEKLHGENMRVFCDGKALHVGSRTRWKKVGVGGWWRAAAAARLDFILQGAPGIAWYGEAHGYTGGYPYGTNKQATFRAFDAFDPSLGRYVDYDNFAAVAKILGIDTAPVLYRGPWDPELARLAEGQSTLDASHVREGIVVRPIRERFDDRLGRVILKLHGEGFLLAQGKNR